MAVLTMETIGSIFPGAKRAAIIRAVKEQGLPGRKVGREWYFDEDAVRAWMARPCHRAEDCPDAAEGFAQGRQRVR